MKMDYLYLNFPGGSQPRRDEPKPRLPEWQPSIASIRLQPVFRMDGRVAEYALVRGGTEPADAGPAARDVWATIFSLRRDGKTINLSIPWTESYENGRDLAQRLRLQLEVDAARYQDRIRREADGSIGAMLASLSQMITFAVPMNYALTPCKSLVHGYPNFKIHLRVNIAPLYKNGIPSGLSELRVSGLGVRLPKDAENSLPAQEQFRIICNVAAAKKLQVFVKDIDRIDDMVWLRAYREVLFQGDALSLPLSCDLLNSWWSRDPDWQSFSISR